MNKRFIAIIFCRQPCKNTKGLPFPASLLKIFQISRILEVVNVLATTFNPADVGIQNFDYRAAVNLMFFFGTINPIGTFIYQLRFSVSFSLQTIACDSFANQVIHYRFRPVLR
jgi:hypothetical protein